MELPVPEASLLATPDTFAKAQARFWADASPWLIVAFGALFVGARVMAGPLQWQDGAVVGLLALFWPANEWLIHVLLLHFEPKKLGPFTLDLHVARLHRMHHKDPWDIPLTFVPKRAFIHVGLALAIARAAWGAFPAWVDTGLAFYFAMGLRYEWAHYLSHIRYTPRWAEELKRAHRIHHFKAPERNWGVSMTAADGWFRTRVSDAT